MLATVAKREVGLEQEVDSPAHERKIALKRKLHLAAVRRFGRFLMTVSRTTRGRRVVEHLRRTGTGNAALDALVGFRRVLPSMAEAEACARRFSPYGHEHVDNATIHIALGQNTRPSDYAVLFYMARAIRSDHFRVFDLGGNVGNLYYSYRRHLTFPANTSWTVCDVPAMMETGRQIAEENGATAVHFTSNFAEANGCDVLLASGCLHYFERPLAQMLAELRNKPRHVFVNRTPLIETGAVVTVQDNESFLTPCTLYGRREMIAGMAMLGYELVDSWPALERSFRIPCYPEFDAESYSGAYFALRP